MGGVNYSLKYAYKDGSGWHPTVVDVAAGSEQHQWTSIELDSNEYPHISYHAWMAGDLKYARWDGSTWQKETVVSTDYVGLMTSLELDSSDYPHITHYNYTDEILYYVYWDGAAWQSDAIDSGAYGSLMLDSQNRPHVSYGSSSKLKYAYFNGSDWQTEYADTSLDGCQFTSLALDANEFAHISYLDVNGGTLKYAHRESGAAVDSVDLSANAKDDGVLLSWSIVGDEPASVSVLRSVNENQSIALSGELTGSATSWLDVSVEAGVEYAYWLEVTELDGTVSRFGPSEIVVPGAVSELALSDPYPNPASDALTISYELAVEGAVSLSVYDLSGRLVETLVSGNQTAGRHSVSWDSSTAATGVYLIRLEAAGEAITKRAVISR